MFSPCSWQEWLPSQSRLQHWPQRIQWISDSDRHNLNVCTTCGPIENTGKHFNFWGRRSRLNNHVNLQQAEHDDTVWHVEYISEKSNWFYMETDENIFWIRWPLETITKSAPRILKHAKKMRTHWKNSRTVEDKRSSDVALVGNERRLLCFCLLNDEPLFRIRPDHMLFLPVDDA